MTHDLLAAAAFALWLASHLAAIVALSTRRPTPNVRRPANRRQSDPAPTCPNRLGYPAILSPRTA
jgi:hypothetical protein